MPILKDAGAWCRRHFGWSNSRQSWEERIGTAALIAAGIGLWWYRSALPSAMQVFLWGVLLLAGAVLLRRGWLKLFGPVLFYDMVRSARRGRYILLRCGYALLLFFFLFVVFQSHSRYGLEVSSDAAARIAQDYFYTFMIVQLVAVLLLTPAYVAGSVADEKTHRTLEFMLATDLRNREIILSKLGSRLANLSLFVLTGLPILSFLQFLGGVDPNLVLSGFAVTALTMVGLAGIGILASVYCKRPRDAIAATYLIVFCYYAISMLTPLWYLYSAWLSVSSEWLNNLILFVTNIVEGYNAGNLGAMYYRVAEASRQGTLAVVVPEELRKYALFHGLLGLAGTVLAVWRLRPTALKQMGTVRGGRGPRGGWLRFRRPQVSTLPMLWKELHVEGGLRFHWIMWLIVLVVMMASFLPVYFILQNYRGGNRWMTPDWFHREINMWVRWMTAVVGSLLLLAVGVRAATCISGERDRQTLDSLLTTPMTAHDILLAKWIGNITSLRLAWIWPAAVWLAGLLLGGLHPVALPLIIGAWILFASFMSLLGCWFSIISRTSMRAVVFTLLTAFGLTIGHWLPWFCCMPFGPAGRDFEILAKFQAGITPPVVLGLVPFIQEDFEYRGNDGTEMVAFSVCGMFLWMCATLSLWAMTITRFRKVTLRGGEMPWPPSGQVRRAPPRRYAEDIRRNKPQHYELPQQRSERLQRGQPPPPEAWGVTLIEETWELPREIPPPEKDRE